MTARRALKTRLAVVAALLVTLFVGRLWGVSGRRGLDQALQAAVLRADLLEAHAALLGARVSLCSADFGEVSQRLDHARVFVGRAGARLGTAGVQDELLRLDLAAFGAGIDEARQLAARLTRGADSASRVYSPVGTWPRYPTVDAARVTAAALLREDRVQRVMIVRDEMSGGFVEWRDR